MFAFFRPAVHQAPLPEEKIDSTYRRLRWQIFAGIFFGYAGYYLLRKNFSLAMAFLAPTLRHKQIASQGREAIA